MSSLSEKIVLDLETKKGFDEVEARRLDLLGVSAAGIYSYSEDCFKVFAEHEINNLIPYLERAGLIIGFNIDGFDLPVLQPYLDVDLSRLNTLDIFAEVQQSLGFRLGLNSIARATLNTAKLGSGLDALKYFRQGKIQELMQYCQHDVMLTRNLYEYGLRHGYLLYLRGTKVETIPISWGKVQPIQEILKEAFRRQLTLEIEYSAGTDSPGMSSKRQIDIYNFDPGRVVAFCHLRQEMRTFNPRRILSARLTQNQYKIPTHFDL